MLVENEEDGQRKRNWLIVVGKEQYMKNPMRCTGL